MKKMKINCLEAIREEETGVVCEKIEECIGFFKPNNEGGFTVTQMDGHYEAQDIRDAVVVSTLEEIKAMLYYLMRDKGVIRFNE
jgi:hypothetical protein